MGKATHISFLILTARQPDRVDQGKHYWLVSDQSQEALLWCREQPPGCGIRFCRDHLQRHY